MESKFTKRVLFMGVPDMALIGLDALTFAGVNIVGVIGPKKTSNTYKMFKNFVSNKGLNFIEYDSLSDDELINTIKELNIDIGVVFSFNDIIPKVFIDSVKDGIINVHPSLLPKYRGGNPYSRAIINGETQTGVTLHYISEDLDKGDIIAQETCNILPRETMGTLFNRTNMIGANMLIQALKDYEENGSLPRKEQPEGEFVTAPNIKDTEVYINYEKSAVEIDRLVRGLNPFFSAITLYKNLAVKVFKVTVSDYEDTTYNLGEICKIEDDKVYIKTSSGCIIPEIIQFGGYFLGDCADFIKIVKPQLGDKFSNENT